MSSTENYPPPPKYEQFIGLTLKTPLGVFLIKRRKLGYEVYLNDKFVGQCTTDKEYKEIVGIKLNAAKLEIERILDTIIR